MSKECPCYDKVTKQDCSKRHVGCHAKCPEYIDWITLRQSIKKQNALIQKANNQIISDHVIRKAKSLRDRKRRRS